MTQQLDRTRPYGEVHGGTVVLYEQDGLLFNRKGRQTTIEAANIPELDEDVIIPVTDAPLVDYHSLPSNELKIMVEAFGEKYTSKIKAIEFLEGKSELA